MTTRAETIAVIEERNRSAGDKTAAALLALHRSIRTTHPELFAETSALLHEALNDAARIAYATRDLSREEQG